jgi:hypothetical protein
MRRILNSPVALIGSFKETSGSTVVTPHRFLRNLHQRRHVRAKSLVRNRRKYSRNWMLRGNNNFETHETVAHEREATEMFAAYKCDDTRLWESIQLSTTRLESLPPRERLDAIVGEMRYRWNVRDGGRGYDKAKMILSALECFPLMVKANQIGSFDEVGDQTQDIFVQFVVALGKVATEALPTHPNALAMVIRAAEICDEFGCMEQRDSMLSLAENCAKNLCKPYSFEREGEEIALAMPTPDQIGKAMSAALRLRNGEPSHLELQKENLKRAQAAAKYNPRALPWSGHKAVNPYDRFHRPWVSGGELNK